MIIATAETILGAYRPPAMPGENAIGIQHPPSPPQAHLEYTLLLEGVKVGLPANLTGGGRNLGVQKTNFVFKVFL
jgi:hypothetical protein